MRGRLLKEFLVLALIAVAIWWGLTQLSLAPDDPTELLTESQERALGEILVGQILTTHEEVDAPEFDAAIDVIAGRLIAASEKQPDAYRVVVVKSMNVNAMTFPGGTIIVFSGLINITESPEELAAVLAHEMAHIEKRHVTQKLLKTLGIEVVALVLSGGDLSVLSDVVEIVVSTMFDRSQEREADRHAMDLLIKANINPRAMVRFFRRLMAHEGKLGEVLEIVSTHPGTESRMREALQFRLPEDAAFEPFELDWKAVKSALP